MLITPSRSPAPPDPLGALLRRRRWIGLALLIGVLAGVPLAVVKPNPFHQPVVVHARFDEAVGIAVVQRDVRVAGVRVGRIGDVRRIGDDAEVELLIDDDIGEIHGDARAALRPHAPYEGTAFIDLDPGSPGAGALGYRPIPKSRTTVYVSLDQALRAFDAPTRTAFKELVHELAPGLGPAGQKGIGRALDNAPLLMRDVAVAARAAQGPRGDELREVIAGMAATADAYAGQNRRLARTVADTRRTLDAFAVDRTASIDSTIAQAPATLREIVKTRGIAERLIGRAEALSEPLAPAFRELARTAVASTPLVRDLRPTGRALPPVLDDLRGGLAAGGRSGPAVQSVFEALGATAKTMRNSLLPMLHRESSLGLPAYLQLGAGFTSLTGLLKTFERPGQNPNGYGHLLRGTLDVAYGLQGPGPLPVPCSSFDELNPGVAQVLRGAGLCMT